MTSFPSQPLTLHLGDQLALDEAQFFRLCESNRELRIERTREGDLEIMSPAGGQTSKRNAEIVWQLLNWAKKSGRGEVFDSSGGFVLEDGAIRSPDAAWVEKARWRALEAEQKERFIPLCPDFVIELRSPSDPVDKLVEKMREYVANGASLGWLIDPQELRVHVFTAAVVTVLEEPREVHGEGPVEGFVLELEAVW